MKEKLIASLSTRLGADWQQKMDPCLQLLGFTTLELIEACNRSTSSVRIGQLSSTCIKYGASCLVTICVPEYTFKAVDGCNISGARFVSADEAMHDVYDALPTAIRVIETAIGRNAATIALAAVIGGDE